MIFRNKNMHFDPKKCKLKIGNEILERMGTDSNKYFKFVELKSDEFLNCFTMKFLTKELSFFYKSQFYNTKISTTR